MITNIRKTYNEFPKSFWTLMLGVFIDRLGGALIFPFFALFITARFNVGMTEVGYLFAVLTITGLFGSFLGGAMTDKFGRKTMMLYGLIISGLSSLSLIFIDNLPQLYLVGAFIGLLGNLGGPASQAMIADLLPEEKRTEGFGIFRVTFNLSVTFGPLIGGFLAEQSYNWLFIIDAVSSVITGLIVWLAIPETKPQKEVGEPEETFAESVGGYRKVFKDVAFMIFIGVGALSTAVYLQMNTSLSVYMRDIASLPVKYFGYILSMNAAMVVFLQFWFTRRISNRPPMLMMTLGTALYAIGFGIFGFGLSVWVFVLGMIILTIGEMIVSPVWSTLVAKFAPEDMRGRYMAIGGFSWAVPNMIAPLLAGLILDNLEPHWLWYACLIVGSIAASGYYMLHRQASSRLSLEEQVEMQLAESQA
jgi:MFS family permease